MLVKVSAQGRTLDGAIRKMTRALKEFRIRGVKTNIHFLQNVIQHDTFREGKVTVNFIQNTPALFQIRLPQDRTSKAVKFLAEVTVNGNSDVKNIDTNKVFRTAKAPKFNRSESFPKGTKDLLTELGPEAFCQWLKEDKKIHYTDTTMRDAHQSLLATRMRSYDMLKVARPKVIKDYNQIFARDISFVIEDKIIIANILPDRKREIEATEYVWQEVDISNRIILPEECHIEGGDVMPWNDYIFIGTYSGEDYPDYITARTNIDAVITIQELFPDKVVKSFELRKSNTDPKENALHLDCCFQPIGKDKAILHKNGFLVESEYQWLVDFFEKDNIFEITKDEMYNMNSNVFSISEDVIISEKNFTRLNKWLRQSGFTVEEVHYAEIAKQEGLLRCSTMPLIRD